jgi:signal transduction histidine kinase
MQTAALDPLIMPIRGRLLAAWSGLSLIQKFALIALLVIAGGTTIIGAWVAKRIESAVVQNSAHSAALYMSGLVEPIVHEIAPNGVLTPDQGRKLDELFSSKVFGDNVVSIKIWVNGAKVAYSNHKEVIGHEFPLTESLQSAWAGSVSGEYNQLVEDENRAEQQLHVPLLEIYAPMRSLDGSRVVAVGEFYSRAEHLRADLIETRMGGWMIAGLTGLGMFAALYGLVRQAGNTIVEQQAALKDRVAQLSLALSRNEVLSAQVDAANSRSVVMNDRFLRRIGSELHDGPAQLLALALLRLDSVSQPAPAGGQRGSDVETLRKVLNESLKDIRNISGGLSLPDIQDLPLARALELCARSHERRTASTVECTLDPAPDTVSAAVKICLYRFVQEGLNNAFRHAAGAGQAVTLAVNADSVEVTVADSGAGFDPAAKSNTDRLGLAGLRDRIVSLGGTFTIRSSPGIGCRLIAGFNLAARGTLND